MRCWRSWRRSSSEQSARSLPLNGGFPSRPKRENYREKIPCPNSNLRSPPTHTASDAPAASPLPAPARSGSGSAAPCRFPDNSSPSSPTPAGDPPVPARTGKSGTGSASPDGSSSRLRTGSGSASGAARAAAYGCASGTHIYARMPPRSSPRTSPRAPGPPPTGRQSPAAGSIPCIPAGIQTGFFAPPRHPPYHYDV